MDSFIIALVMVFLAEMGDKTQLVALTLAGRYRPGVVLLGITAATAVSHIVSVALGGILGNLLAGPWVYYLAGLSFLIFGIWTLRGDEDDGDGIRASATPFLVVFWTFLIAEMGDKTMLTTATVTAQHLKHLFPVWLGSTIGMVAADGIAIAVGFYLGTHLPAKPVKIVCATIFLLFGAWSTWTGVKDLPSWSWAVGAVLMGAALVALFGIGRSKSKSVED
ncbi:MAG: hypothetical protein RL173_3046 [Fibrobacterota bacterium]|jgi:putative Ca2+/H+ antiporter (TMEM165/GDT1 family)